MDTVTGWFSDRETAANAVHALEGAGFDTGHMGLVTQEPSTAQTASGARIAANVLIGGAVGAVLGVILGATGLLVVPGIGSLIAGGALATAIVGAVVGMLTGALVSLGIPNSRTRLYQGYQEDQQRLARGGVLVTVDTNGRAAIAHDILVRNGADSPSVPSQATVLRDMTTGAASSDEAGTAEDADENQREPGSGQRGSDE